MEYRKKLYIGFGFLFASLVSFFIFTAPVAETLLVIGLVITYIGMRQKKSHSNNSMSKKIPQGI